MKRLAAIVVGLAILAACSSGPDPNRLRFEAPKLFAAPVGPVTFTVAPDDQVYYAELRTFDVYSVARGDLPKLLFHSQFKPDSLAVDAGTVYVAARTRSHKLTVTAYRFGNPEVVWHGPPSHMAAHLAISPTGRLIVGYADKVLELLPVHRVLARGYTDPVVTFGRGNRIWVADNALPGQIERVSRTKLPPYTNPSGITLIGDELLLCSRTHHKVYRLHIGKDGVPRWRKNVGQLKCDRDIGAMSDGSVVTAQTSVIYRYPPRT